MDRENKRELSTGDIGILSEDGRHELAYYAVRAGIVKIHDHGCKKDNVAIPDNAVEGVITYVYGEGPMSLVLGSRSISTDELRSGETLTVETITPSAK